MLLSEPFSDLSPLSLFPLSPLQLPGVSVAIFVRVTSSRALDGFPVRPLPSWDASTSGRDIKRAHLVPLSALLSSTSKP